jgi:hypothetical protein
MRSSRALPTALFFAAAFVLLALGADMLLSTLLRQSGAPDSQVGRLTDVSVALDEIPIIGASKAADAYIPSILGPRFFNYGLSDTSLDVANTLLALELKKKTKSPVVVDVGLTPLPHIGDVRAFIPYARDPEIRGLLQRYDVYHWHYAVPGLRYFGYFDWYGTQVLDRLLAKRVGSTRLLDHGYKVEQGELGWDRAAFESDVREREGEVAHLGLEPDQKARLIQLIRSVPDRTVVVVFSPLHKSYLDHVTGVAGFKQDLADLRAVPNARVIYWGQLPFPDDYYKNTGHLSHKGAVQFSTMFKARLRELGVI